jgi:hypothetical protein
MEATLQLHSRRATRRVEALKMLHSLLGAVSFSSARHQLLSSLRPALVRCRCGCGSDGWLCFH